MEIIDFHTHLGKRSDVTFQRNLAFFPSRRAGGDEQPLRALLADMDRGGIERAVVLGAPVDAGVKHDNAELAAAIAPHSDRLIGFGVFDPRAVADPAAEVRRCIEDYGFKGIGEWGCFDYSDPVCFPAYEACIELDVPLVVHTGTPLPAVPLRFGNPQLLDDVVVRFPELTVVAAHCGVPWFMQLAIVASRHPNVWLDVSLLPRFPKIMRYQGLGTMILAGLGDRLLFGSDFPVCRPSTWAKWLQARWEFELLPRLFGLPPFGHEQRVALMGGNARRLLKL